MKEYRFPNRFESAFDAHAEGDTERRICAGMANTLWAGAWADHEEEVEGRHYAGQEMLDIAAEPTEDQVREVVDWVLDARGQTCELNKVARLSDLYDQGCAADHANDMELDSPEAFGSDLGMEIQGSGVSWFDDHAAFPLELPYKEWGWYQLPWDEHELKLSWPEVKALKDILCVAREAKLGTLKVVGALADVPDHRIDRILAKVEEHFADMPDVDDDGTAEDA